jgi:RNA polymerase sigma-70 factor (ECF subfamily)
VTDSATYAVAEAALVRDARDGNESAFLAIYQQHRLPVFRFAWRLTGSQTAAEDVTQECFLSLIRGAAFDSNRGNLRTYLFGVARNLILRRLRIHAREAESAAEAPASIDLLGDVLAAERSELVARAIAQLPILQREALVLFTFDELSLEQIAEITGVDTGAVKSRLFRARESLRAALSPLLTPCSERKKL